MKKNKLNARITVRLDEEKVARAFINSIDVAEVFRLALDQVLLTVMDKCPTCGQKVKKK